MALRGKRSITPEIEELAYELHRRRIAAGNGVAPDVRTAIAEVAFLDSYGLKPSMEDLKIGKRSLQFVVNDDDGNTVRVIQQKRWPMRVWSSRLDVDSYVFASTATKQVELVGWLPIEQVEVAPIHWQIESGERTDFAHEIERDVTFPLPSIFKFTDPCVHEKFGAIWSYTYSVWECCGCGRFLYNRDDAALIARQDERLGRVGGEGAPGS